MQEVYGFPQDKLIFLPLGGMILPREEYESIRRETRDRYQIEDGKVCLIHSGKLDPSKRTLELLDAYLKRNDRGNSARRQRRRICPGCSDRFHSGRDRYCYPLQEQEAALTGAGGMPDHLNSSIPLFARASARLFIRVACSKFSYVISLPFHSLNFS